MEYVEKLVNSTMETSFMAGAEVACEALVERMYLAKTKVNIKGEGGCIQGGLYIINCKNYSLWPFLIAKTIPYGHSLLQKLFLWEIYVRY
jgi:hypothetical protein